MSSPRMSVAKTSLPTLTLPLVWVTVGKTQHSAYLIEENETNNQCLIQWTLTQQMEHVQRSHVETSLSPRRRKSPDRLSFDDEQTRSNVIPEKQRSNLKSDESSRSTSPPRKSARFSLTRVAPTSRAKKEPEQKAVNCRTTRSFYSSSLHKLNQAQDEHMSSKYPFHDGRTASNDDQASGNTKPNNSTRQSNETFCGSSKDNKSQSSKMPTDDTTVRDNPQFHVADVTDDSRTSSSEPSERTSPSNMASDASANTSTAEPVTSFPLIKSAYVQNLAEICNIITKDGRWRVGGNDSELLLRWEDGVDMSAVTYLSRCYIPPAPVVRRTMCKCLLCRDKPHTIETELENSKSRPNDAQNIYDASAATNEVPLNEEIRWLHLYCRLFYRRGPWFRIDDIYERYYKPGKRGKQPDNDSENDAPGSFAALAREQKNPTDASVSNDHREAQPKTGIHLDESSLEKHLDCFDDLVRDFSQLSQAGLIRTFRDEEECGKTVGVTLLTADMRTTVLGKLGGKRRKPTNGAGSQSESRNAIWTQMKQQQSIFSSFSGTGNRLLPVQKHVGDVILAMLVANILKSCCNLASSSYVPASIYKQHAMSVKQRLQRALLRDGLSHYSCLRLREEAFLALIRCCRLYLCATSGPGDMRSNETNGWKSLLVARGTPPLHKRIRRPGLDTWCFVTYPGSLNRFGKMSLYFANAFEPVDPSLDEAAQHQIFFSRRNFLAWEAVVELRANVDYLLELTELVRYETRRMERDDDQRVGRRVVGTFSGDSVDYLGLLTEEGRKSIVKRYFGASGQVKPVCSKITGLLESASGMELREWERVLIVAAILCTCVLDERYKTISEPELAFMEARPWLRHLWFDGCLAYILFDLISVLEKFGLYDFAVASLRSLLFGRETDDGLIYEQTFRLAPLLLSRRARGKALDRLIIDLNHVGKQENNWKSEKEKKAAAKSRMGDQASFCEIVLAGEVQSASIPFSAIRVLARRLKRPLVETIGSRLSLEAQELGLRLQNSPIEKESEKKKGYQDWTPVTDFAMANNTLGPEASVGTRCVFVGHEDGSLNVEQLAMECYKSGKLPGKEVESENNLAGWEGWHDEGGHIRAIFRIVCGGPLLGMDWGCSKGAVFTDEYRIVHISPHQGAPFDLHVGFEISRNSVKGHFKPTTSFYSRRRDRIESFLEKIGNLDQQGICDLVFDSVSARLAYAAETQSKDPNLKRDLENVRTLSLIAAGCGGEQLAAIFRCLLFDYRHWSGGLPDLLLVRALSKGSEGAPPSLIDLSTWIGESFSEEFRLRLNNQAGVAMLADEEFLGCSKVGDSGGTQMRSSRRSMPLQSDATPSRSYTTADLPQKLELSYNGVTVAPQCMMVEVKSSNDRLDPRQEDWLNVLDRYGNARVCKFEDSKKFERRERNEVKAAAAAAKT